jgi:hypothetical protein
MKKLTTKQRLRLRNARKDFKKIEAEIRPFVKRAPIIQPSTAGKWTTASSTGVISYNSQLLTPEAQ